ncbi:MAG: DNA repair protein RecN, partial [Acidimicrobiales bacterium]
MLVELRVRNLGVIDDLVLRVSPSMTALTGETGAGKTLLVEALELLVGGRADPSLVRAGEDAATVEGRFVTAGEDGEEEIVLGRELPADGRSRAYVNGQMATAAALAELGANLLDLHGQHAHQSLLHQRAQREALDRFAGVTTGDVDEARARVRGLDARLAELGGDERVLARELDLLRYQLDELGKAAVSSKDEEGSLEMEAAVLTGAESLRHAAIEARLSLDSDDPAAESPASVQDLVGRAQSALAGQQPFVDIAARLEGLAAELADVAGELRQRAEKYFADPERLAEIGERRRLLSDLRRKYGPSLGDVMEFERMARVRLEDLEAGESRRTEIAREQDKASAELREAEQRLGDARRTAAPLLAKEIEAHLHRLALGNASLEIVLPPEGRGDEVEFRLSANPGEPPLPLARVASGGELARAMLATRLVTTEAPPTLVFDEVDAGIGGEAALAVGRALAELGQRHQVLVVTHLAQVAAFADEQVAIEKAEVRGRTITSARTVDGDERLAELSR